MNIYKINKDGNPSTKNTRHVGANVNTQKEDQNNQNNSNEVENLMLKGHRLLQIS
jgi:ABC-type xylose transport system substrate-binding protein